jgi:hypothetical protein
LLIFEGALRKWVLPGLATPLIVVRDPVALWLVYTASKKGLLKSGYVKALWIIGVISTITAVLLGHGNIAVAIFGARILWIHFPLIFVIGNVFDRNEVVKMGKVLIYISIPMAVLIGLQFYSPQSALVNIGVGGDTAGGGFSGAMGFFRPPGTFSFTTGTSQFFGFAACFILYFWFFPEGINRGLLLAATIGLVAAIPFSISRGLFFQVMLAGIFTALAFSRKPKYTRKIVIAIAGIAVIFILFSRVGFFQTATAAFSERFDNADAVEGGVKGVLVDRFLGGLVGVIVYSLSNPIFGYGIGMGTNIGAMLLTGQTKFLIAEGEWGRVIGEQGPIIGLMVIFIRLSIGFRLAKACYRKLASGDFLPWLLLSFSLLSVFQGGWAQATSLGFCVISGGLTLASLKNKKQKLIRPQKAI